MSGAIAAVLVAFGVWMVFRHHDTKEEHRSFLQWVVWTMFRVSRFGYAVATAFDCGYLRYRKALEESDVQREIVNERELGKLLKPTPKKDARREIFLGFESSSGGNVS